MDNRQYPKEFQTLGVLGVIIGKYRILRKQKTPAVHSASCAVRAECTLGSVLCGFSPRNLRKPDHIAVFFTILNVSESYMRQSHANNFRPNRLRIRSSP